MLYIFRRLSFVLQQRLRCIHWLPVDFDIPGIVVLSAACTQSVVPKYFTIPLGHSNFSIVWLSDPTFTFLNSIIHHLFVFPPSFMHAATATRPLALITSQPTTNDYTVVSIGVVLFFWLFFCMAASANVRIWNPRIFCLAFRILVVVPSPYTYIQKSKIK